MRKSKKDRRIIALSGGLAMRLVHASNGRYFYGIDNFAVLTRFSSPLGMPADESSGFGRRSARADPEPAVLRGVGIRIWSGYGHDLALSAGSKERKGKWHIYSSHVCSNRYHRVICELISIEGPSARFDAAGSGNDERSVSSSAVAQRGYEIERRSVVERPEIRPPFRVFVRGIRRRGHSGWLQLGIDYGIFPFQTFS